MFYYYIFWDIGLPTENGTYKYFNKYIGLRYNLIKSMFYEIIAVQTKYLVIARV